MGGTQGVCCQHSLRLALELGDQAQVRWGQEKAHSRREELGEERLRGRTHGAYAGAAKDPTISATLWLPLCSRISTLLVPQAACSCAMKERLACWGLGAAANPQGTRGRGGDGLFPALGCVCVRVYVYVRTQGSQAVPKETPPASIGREWWSW